MKCLANLLCALLIASVSIESNVAQTSSGMTYEDAAKQRKIAEEENYLPSTLPETTTPQVPNYIPGEGVYALPEYPDYDAMFEEIQHKEGIQYKEPYIAQERSNSYSESLSKNSYQNKTPSPSSLSPYGPKVNIKETHTMGSDGIWRPKQKASLFTYETIDDIFTAFGIAFLVVVLCCFFFTLDDQRARKKSTSTTSEKKWISCDSTTSINTNSSHIIQDMQRIASPINVLGKQTGDLEKVITFILTLTEDGMKNFSIEDLSKTQQLEIFLFDACMAKYLLLVTEKIPNVYVPEIDKRINTAYRDLIDKLGINVIEKFLEAKDLIEFRTPFYLKDIQGLQNCDYPRTKMYIPYGLYFFIQIAPLDSILEQEEAFEEIARCPSDMETMGYALSFLKAFEPHYNWLLNRINTF